MAEERWEEHPVFEKYKISTLGRVKRKGKPMYLKGFINKYGNIIINFKNEHNDFQSQRPLKYVVAETFLLKPEPTSRILLKDGNKLNCTLDNLEWKEYSYPTKRKYREKENA